VDSQALPTGGAGVQPHFGADCATAVGFRNPFEHWIIAMIRLGYLFALVFSLMNGASVAAEAESMLHSIPGSYHSKTIRSRFDQLEYSSLATAARTKPPQAAGLRMI